MKRMIDSELIDKLEELLEGYSSNVASTKKMYSHRIDILVQTSHISFEYISNSNEPFNINTINLNELNRQIVSGSYQNFICSYIVVINNNAYIILDDIVNLTSTNIALSDIINTYGFSEYIYPLN